MLLRALIVTEAPETASRIAGLLDPAAVSARVGAASELASAPDSCDLLLVDDSLLAQLADHPLGGPLLVAIGEPPPASEQADRLATGVGARLPLDLDDAALAGALGGLVARRRADLAAAQPSADDVAARDISPRIDGFVTRSPAMSAFMRQAAKVARSPVTVLLAGETGVGKEWLARALHKESPRANGPFVAINCGALPDALLESELFGHEAGAFTGAQRARRGMFELAHGGTLFLDEVGEMPLHLQVKLLRAMATREIQRLGSEETLCVDIRLISATNRELDAEIEAGRFRADLYYRLSVVRLELPPLRERREDIPDLVRAYVDHFRAQFPSEVETITAPAMAALVAYRWPGNIRELTNCLERAVLLCESEAIGLEDLPDEVAGSAAEVGPAGSPPAADAELPATWVYPRELLELPFKQAREQLLASFERSYFTHLLALTEGRVGLTAKQAGIDPRSLFDKMKKLELDKSSFQKG